MLALKIVKIPSVKTSIIVRNAGKFRNASVVPTYAIAEKKASSFTVAGRKGLLTPAPLQMLTGNVSAMRLFSEEPSLHSRTMSKLRVYWNDFLDKKQKFEDDVDQYLARWPKIQMFRRSLIARMQAIRRFIFERIVDAVKYMTNKDIWEMNFYRTVAFIWDATGTILNWIKTTFDTYILKNPTVQLYQNDFIGKMEKSKELVPFPPGKKDVENFLYRLVALVWDSTLWIINSTVMNFNQHVMKNPKVRLYWSQFMQKMEKAKNGTSSNRPPPTIIN